MASQTIQSTPVIDGASEDVRRVPVDVLNLRWVYCHYPTAWAFRDDQWVPELAQISFRKGLNGQGEDGQYQAHELHVANKGGTIIKPTNPRLGKHKNYLVSVPAYMKETRAGGKFYCSKWETPTVIGGNSVKWKVDSKGYNEFLTHLIDSGIIEPISPSVVAMKIDIAKGTVEALQAQQDNPLRASKIKNLLTEIGKMEASLAEMEDPFDVEMSVQVEAEDDESEAPVAKKMAGRPKRS